MEPMETNGNGAKHARIDTGFHLGFPSRGALEVARMVKEGAPLHGVNNWRGLSAEDHINHALTHLMRLLDPHEQPPMEDHLAHAATRLLMALDVRAAAGRESPCG